MNVIVNVKAFFAFRLSLVAMIAGSLLMTAAYVLFLLVALLLPVRTFIFLTKIMPWTQPAELHKREEIKPTLQ